MPININTKPTTPQAGSSEASWIAQAAANGWSDPKALIAAIDKYNNAGTSEFDPASDPTLAKLISQGYLTPTQVGGSDSSQSIYSGANLPQSAGGWAPAFFQQTGSGYKGPVIPGGSKIDPLYGSITGNSYLPQSKSFFMDTIAPMIPLLFAGLPAMLESGSLFASTPGLGMAKTAWGLTQAAGNGSLDNILNMLTGGNGQSQASPIDTALQQVTNKTIPGGATAGAGGQESQLLSILMLLGMLGKGGTTSS